MILPRDLRHFIEWNMANHFTLYYQLRQHHLLTFKQIAPFSCLITPLPLRRIIGCCSWSLRNEESKGLEVRLRMPYTIPPLIINHATLIIISSRNSVRVVLLIAQGWRAKAKSTLGRLSWVVTTLWALYLLFLVILSWHSTQKKYNTYGVDFLTTCITQGRLVPTLGYQTYNAFSVELEWYYKLCHFMR